MGALRILVYKGSAVFQTYRPREGEKVTGRFWAIAEQVASERRR